MTLRCPSSTPRASHYVLVVLTLLWCSSAQHPRSSVSCARPQHETKQNHDANDTDTQGTLSPLAEAECKEEEEEGEKMVPTSIDRTTWRRQHPALPFLERFVSAAEMANVRTLLRGTHWESYREREVKGEAARAIVISRK